MDLKLGESLQQIVQSRVALVGAGVGIPALLVAAIVRLIPWTLFFLVLVLLVVGLVVFIVARQWWATRKDRRLQDELDAQTSRETGRTRVAGRKDIKDLQEEWKKSVAALQKSRIGRQRRPLYFLPWYVIIGAPASGKTTAIQNSGLTFPGDVRAKLKGTGGTKNCDWFFADEAILLDTAGRYTFQEESAEWLEFLKLMRKYRPREPLNGLIIAVPANLLMSDDRDEVVNYGNGIRIKIDEIVRELGIQFPVYVLVTKCDLIEGFTDFFGRLPKRRLDELLGWTNPSWEKTDPRQLVKGAMDEFRARVLALRTSFLQEEDRAEPLRKLYLLPRELEAFQDNIVEFCDVLFKETQFNEAAFLRGIYLTSGMQTGSAVSRLIDRLGLPAHATTLQEEHKSYFLKDFFKGRLPADRKLVAITGRAGGRLQIVHNLALVAGVLVFVLASVITAGSYVANRTLLNNLETEISLARNPQQEAPARVGALARYAGALERLQYRNERRPWYTGLGLDTGDRAFSPARDLFLRQFGTYDYVPPVEGARRAVRERDADRSFPGLDALITDHNLSRKYAGRSPMTSEGDAPERLESLLLFWAGGQLPPQEVQQAYGRTYVDFLRWRDPGSANAEQERDAVLVREALPELMTVDRVAAWVDRFYKPVRAEDANLPPALANGAQVRGAFTLAALGERVKPLTDAVIEADPELTRRFRREWVERYFREWHDFLMRPKDAAEGVIPAETLLGLQTPYLALIGRAATETAIGTSQPPGWVRAVAHVAEGRDAYVGLLQGIAKELAAARATPAMGLEAAKGIFKAPAIAAVADGDAPPPADAFGKAERWAITTTGAGTPVDADEVEMRTRLSTLLRVPVYAAFGAYLQAAHGEINRQWNLTVRATPGADPALLWAKPGGTIWQFYAMHLDPFLDSITYLPKTRYTKSLPVNAGLATALKTGEKRAGTCPPGRKFKFVFDSLPTTDPPGGSLRVTRTVLNMYCGEGAPWSLEHRQYHRSEQLLWSPDACSRVELQVYVGSPDSGMGDERLLESKTYNSLLDFLHDGQQSGGVRSWTLGGQATVRFQVSEPPDVALCTQGGLPAVL